MPASRPSRRKFLSQALAFPAALDVYEARLDVASGRLIQKAEKIAAKVVGDNFDPLYSPDGRWMSYLSNRNFGYRYGSTLIVIRDLASGQERDLAVPFENVRRLAWSPDSSSLLFLGKPRDRFYGVYRIGVGGGEAEFLFQAIGADGEMYKARNLFWMPDGRSVHYRAGSRGGTNWIHDLSTGERHQILTGEEFGRLTPSPDGSRFAVIVQDEFDQYMFTRDLENGQQPELWRMRSEDGYMPPSVAAWTPDRKTILHWRRKMPRPAVVELWAVPADGGEARRTELWVEDLTRPVETLSLHPDGERITFSAGNPKHEIWKLSNFLTKLATSD